MQHLKIRESVSKDWLVCLFVVVVVVVVVLYLSKQLLLWLLHMCYCTLQALVYDILPSTPESDAQSVVLLLRMEIWGAGGGGGGGSKVLWFVVYRS